MFPSVPKRACREIYEGARHGLFHDGLSRNGIRIEPAASKAIAVDSHGIFINPTRLLAAIERDLESYLAALRKPRNAKLRKNFEKMWR